MGVREMHEIGVPYAPTRRGLLGGAAAGAAGFLGGPLLTSAGARTVPEPCVPEPLGITTGPIAVAPGGRTLWSTDLRLGTITAHRTSTLVRGRSLDVGGPPVALALSPRGDLALVTTGYGRPGLSLVDLRTGDVDRLDVGEAPGAVAFSRDGRRAYVAGGGADGTLTRVDVAVRRAHDPIAVGGHPRGLVLHPDGRSALVALNAEAAVALVSLTRRRVTRRVRTTAFPAQVAISADGRRALVTHNGLGARAVTPMDLVARRARRPFRVGADPAGVAFARAGSLALVTAAGAGSVVLLDARTGRRRRTVRPGGAPRSVVVAGTRAFAADGDSGRITVVRTGVRR